MVDRSTFQPGELMAAAGGVLLALSLFATSYKSATGPGTLVDGRRQAASAWEVHDVSRWLLLAAAVAPLILAVVVLRGHGLSRPGGELVAVAGIAAVGLVFYNGVIDRGGDPSGQVGLALGWYAMMVAAVLVAAGGVLLSGGPGALSKPPGVH